MALTFSGATATVDGVSVTSPYTLTKSCTLKFVSTDLNYGLNVNGNKVYDGTETFDLADVDVVVTRQAPSKGNGATVYVNYTESVAKKTVDLTTLSGWVNLSDGNHTIKIVAKGTGYSNSEKSAGVEVVKAPQVYTDCLTFTGKESEFTLKASYTSWDGTLEYSTDHTNWTTLSGTEEMQSVGRKLYLRGKGNTAFYGIDNGVQWELSAKADCSGNIQTLLDYENPPTSISTEYCYYEMFKDCTNLTTAPELPATILADYCYQWMFDGCTSLTSAPELPATTLATACYANMFSLCTSLITAPELPATTLAMYCYSFMFQGCASLTTIPQKLPATTLANECYEYMFKDCTSLTTAPELPATTLVEGCYYIMFANCTKLKVNTTSGTKIFKCPSYYATQNSVSEMFTNTGGSFTGTPTAGTTYYYTEDDSSNGETWVLDESVNGLTLVSTNVSFISNGNSYTWINARKGYIAYSNSELWDDANMVYDTVSWTNQAYRTITFATAPTGDLLTWLQANGVKQDEASNVVTLSNTNLLAPMSVSMLSVTRGTFSAAAEPTFYTTNNNADKVTVGNKGYALIEKINDDNATEIVTANQFFEAFGITKTNKGTVIAGNWEFCSSFGGRLTTTQGTDGGNFEIWGTNEDGFDPIKSMGAIENLLFVVYDTETDTAAAYELDEYNEKYGTFKVSAEVSYNKITAFAVRVIG